MSYKHIIVAVDLTEESKLLVTKAVTLAKVFDANVSFIHIDACYAELYTGLIDINQAETQHQSTVMEASQEAMKNLVTFADYPIHKTLVSNKDLSGELYEAIKSLDVNLVVCGHHQDFWSKLSSSTNQVINSCQIDVLVVPL